MRNRKLFAALLVAALAITALVPAALADTIKIGGLAPLTGEVAQYGIAVKEGVDLYIEQLNAAGGINGDQVEIIWYDEKGDETEAVNAYNRLVEEDKVSAIIGDVTSKPSLAVGDRAVEIGIPIITASSTNYFVTDGKPNYFRSCFLDPFQAGIMADFAKDQFGAAKVAVIYDNADDYSVGLAESFKAKAEANGQAVVAYEAGTASDVDFKAQLTNIAAQSPDVLYVAYYYGPAALIVSQAAEVGLNVPFLGCDGSNGIENVITDTALLENKFFYTDHFATDATTEKAVAFIASFTAKYGKAPYSAFNATGYDAALVLAEAIKNAGNTDYAAVVAALKATSVEGVTGKLTFDDHNDPIKSAFVMTFVGGKQTFVKQQNP
ncbi:MAG: ABC transporter substrate-binding protein [Oscillospiraceae bacterium]|nr:ABC transporter substrate-binding protein [Oscillospiraceae bacterium]